MIAPLLHEGFCSGRENLAKETLLYRNTHSFGICMFLVVAIFDIPPDKWLYFISSTRTHVSSCCILHELLSARDSAAHRKLIPVPGKIPVRIKKNMCKSMVNILHTLTYNTGFSSLPVTISWMNSSKVKVRLWAADQQFTSVTVLQAMHRCHSQRNKESGRWSLYIDQVRSANIWKSKELNPRHSGSRNQFQWLFFQVWVLPLDIII